MIFREIFTHNFVLGCAFSHYLKLRIEIAGTQQLFLVPPTMEYKPPTMNTPNSRKPHKVERHAIQQVSTARNLLTDHGAALSPSKRDKADDLLD